MPPSEFSRRAFVVCCVAVVLLGTASGATFTAGHFSDTERASVSIGAADDFTIDVGAATVRPDMVEADSKGVFTVFVEVPARSPVDEDRFSLSLLGGDESVAATRADCKNDGDDWKCKVTFRRQPVVAHFGTGNHTVTLHGWWTDNRDFVATGRLSVIDHGASPNADTSGTDSVGDGGDNATAEAGTGANETPPSTANNSTANEGHQGNENASSAGNETTDANATTSDGTNTSTSPTTNATTNASSEQTTDGCVDGGCENTSSSALVGPVSLPAASPPVETTPPARP